MKNKKWMAEALLWSLAIIVIPLWYLSYPETSFQHNIKPFYIYGSQLTALTGYVLFALSFILATRMKGLEDLFGGLDQVYHLHHKVGKTAFFFVAGPSGVIVSAEVDARFRRCLVIFSSLPPALSCQPG